MRLRIRRALSAFSGGSVLLTELASEYRMKTHPLYDDASKVAAEDGEVVVDGPDGVAVSLTPEAAIETGERLRNSGLEAAGQRRLRDPGLKPDR